MNTALAWTCIGAVVLAVLLFVAAMVRSAAMESRRREREAEAFMAHVRKVAKI